MLCSMYKEIIPGKPNIMLTIALIKFMPMQNFFRSGAKHNNIFTK